MLLEMEPLAGITELLMVNHLLSDSTRVYVAQLINSYGCITNDSITITVLNLPNVDAGSDNNNMYRGFSSTNCIRCQYI